MSIKIILSTLLVILILSCNSNNDEKQNKESAFYNKLNVENFNYNKSDFDNLEKSEGQEYIDFSYNFIQTSIYKRHLNQIGILIDTTNYEYIKRLSYSYKKAGEHQKAIQLMELAIENETDPKEQIAHMGYASWSYLYFYRDYLRTISTIDKILEKTNQDNGVACHGEPCLLLKGQALYRLKRYDEAIKAFTSYQDYQKNEGFEEMDNTLVVFYKGKSYAELGQNDKAIAYFSYLVKDHPHAEAYYQMARIYNKIGNRIMVKQNLDKAKNALQKGYSFKEPYFERFDKVFMYMIDEFEFN